MVKILLKFCLIAIALIGSAQWANAKQINQLIVSCADGDSYYIALNSSPKVYLAEDELVIMGSGIDKIYINAQQTVDFNWDNKSGIEDLKLNDAPTFYWDADVLHVLNLKPGELVGIYSIEGISLFQGRADEQGNAAISLSGRKGVVIVKTQSQTIKFTR